MNGVDHGIFWMPYLFAGLSLLFHMMATAIWFGVSEAEFDSECDDRLEESETPTICVGIGPKIAVSNVIVILIMVVIFVVGYCMDRYDYAPQNGGPSYVCSLRVWSLLYFVLLCVIFLFMLATLYVEAWV
jgi:hypothetical protein